MGTHGEAKLRRAIPMLRQMREVGGMMRKAFILAFLTLVLGWAPQTVALAGDEMVRVFINAGEKNFSPGARVRDGKTYVPLRAGAESLGATVTWEADTQTAVVSRPGKTVRIRASEGIMVEDHLLVPLRLMGEKLGFQVRWDEAARAAYLSSAACPPGG